MSQSREDGKKGVMEKRRDLGDEREKISKLQELFSIPTNRRQQRVQDRIE